MPTIGMALQRSCRVGTIATITQEAHHEPQRASGKTPNGPKELSEAMADMARGGKPRHAILRVFFCGHHTGEAGSPPTRGIHKAHAQVQVQGTLPLVRARPDSGKMTPRQAPRSRHTPTRAAVPDRTHKPDPQRENKRPVGSTGDPAVGPSAHIGDTSLGEINSQ